MVTATDELYYLINENLLLKFQLAAATATIEMLDEKNSKAHQAILRALSALETNPLTGDKSALTALRNYRDGI